MDTLEDMEYNLKYINVHYALIKAFMHSSSNKFLDISYNTDNSKIDIQIVLLTGGVLSEEFLKKANEYLPDFDISIITVYLTKEEFNANIGEWEPLCYIWLENVLFSKAEVL